MTSYFSTLSASDFLRPDLSNDAFLSFYRRMANTLFLTADMTVGEINRIQQTLMGAIIGGVTGLVRVYATSRGAFAIVLRDIVFGGTYYGLEHKMRDTRAKEKYFLRVLVSSTCAALISSPFDYMSRMSIKTNTDLSFKSTYKMFVASDKGVVEKLQLESVVHVGNSMCVEMILFVGGCIAYNFAKSLCYSLFRRFYPNE